MSGGIEQQPTYLGQWNTDGATNNYPNDEDIVIWFYLNRKPGIQKVGWHTQLLPTLSPGHSNGEKNEHGLTSRCMTKHGRRSNSGWDMWRKFGNMKRDTTGPQSKELPRAIIMIQGWVLIPAKF